MLVESLVRGCTSWSKTIATPLIPAVKVCAKALSMGSFPKSAPMFHWLFAWATFSARSKDCIFHGPQHSFLACLEVHLQHHVCSTAMFVKQLWKNVMGSCSPPRCKRANPICCIDPRSGPSLDRAWHWMDCTKCGKLVPQEWDLNPNPGKAWAKQGAQKLEETVQSKLCPENNAKWHKIVHPPATPKGYKGNSFALSQGRYYVGNHKVHIALQNKAWLGHVGP